LENVNEYIKMYNCSYILNLVCLTRLGASV